MDLDTAAKRKAPDAVGSGLSFKDEPGSSSAKAPRLAEDRCLPCHTWPPWRHGTQTEGTMLTHCLHMLPIRVAALPVGGNLVECDGKSCTHEVAWPPEVEGSLKPPAAHAGPPAREFPFKIDPFQQTAINALEAGASGLCS